MGQIGDRDRKDNLRGGHERGAALQEGKDLLDGSRNDFREGADYSKNQGGMGTQGTDAKGSGTQPDFERSDVLTQRGGLQTERQVGPEFGSRRDVDATEGKVEYDPAARAGAERAILSEDEAFEAMRPGATAETYKAQMTRDPENFPGSAARDSDSPRKEAHEIGGMPTAEVPDKRHINPRDPDNPGEPAKEG